MVKNGIKTFDNMLSKQFKDEEFRKEYEAVQLEMNIIRGSVYVGTKQDIMHKELEQYIF